MADRLTAIQGQILNRDKASVEALLGKPLKIGYWTTNEPPPRADAAEIAAYKAGTLDQIWIYASGRVHFNLAGSAAKVDETRPWDLPPNENIV
jgi:hypothetical protein